MVLQTRPLTVEDFDNFVRLPENRDRQFEFIAGRIVEVVSNNYASEIGMFIGAVLLMFVRRLGLGRVTGADGGYMVVGERYIPDAAYISKTRQPEPCHEAYNPLSPDLAVEVLSPSNDPADMRIKVVNYLRAGTTVWLVDPDKKQIEIYAPQQPPKTLGLDGVIEGGDLLPGFRLPVKDIFPDA